MAVDSLVIFSAFSLSVLDFPFCMYFFVIGFYNFLYWLVGSFLGVTLISSSFSMAMDSGERGGDGLQSCLEVVHGRLPFLSTNLGLGCGSSL